MATKAAMLEMLDYKIANAIKQRKWLESNKVWNCPACKLFCIRKRKPGQCPMCHAKVKMVER